MMTRPTINGRPPRTLRDACRDPFDWLEGPHKPAIPPVDKALGVILATAIGAIAATGLLHLWMRGW